MVNRLIEDLGGFALFESCPKNEIVNYTPLFKQIKVNVGENLFSKNEEYTKIFFILSGKVLLQKENMRCNAHTFDILKRFDMFPIIDLFELNRNYYYNAKVTEPTLVLEITKKSLEKIVFSNINIKINYIKLLQSEILQINNLLHDHLIDESFF